MLLLSLGGWSIIAIIIAISYNVGIAMINHPLITIFMGGINHRKWVVYYCYTHITYVIIYDSDQKLHYSYIFEMIYHHYVSLLFQYCDAFIVIAYIYI